VRDKKVGCRKQLAHERQIVRSMPLAAPPSRMTGQLLLHYCGWLLIWKQNHIALCEKFNKSRNFLLN